MTSSSTLVDVTDNITGFLKLFCLKLLSFQVAGENFPLYEAWYKYVSTELELRRVPRSIFILRQLNFVNYQVDPKNIGSIGALDAANFLKKSGLSSAVLGKVRCQWSTLSDDLITIFNNVGVGFVGPQWQRIS